MDINIFINTIILVVVAIFYCLFILFINKKKQVSNKGFLKKIILINPNEKNVLCILLNLLFWIILTLSLIINILFLINILSLKYLAIAFNSLAFVLCLLNIWIFTKKYL